jgi:hypothetical protein
MSQADTTEGERKMRLSNGITIRNDAKVTDYGGQYGYLFWIADSFAPLVYFVRGDSFSDAYANLLEHPRIVRDLKVTDPTHYGFPTWEALEAADLEGQLGHLERNDSGDLLDTEAVCGRPMGAHD